MMKLLLIAILLFGSCQAQSVSKNKEAATAPLPGTFPRLDSCFIATKQLSVFEQNGAEKVATPVALKAKIVQDFSAFIARHFSDDSARILSNLQESEKYQLHRMRVNDNLSAFLFHFDEMAAGNEYWLYLSDISGVISSQAFHFSNDEMAAENPFFSAQNTLPEVAINAEQSNIVITTHRRNGNVYDALVAQHLAYNAGLEFTKIAIVEMESTLPFDTSSRRIIRQLQAPLHDSVYSLKVSVKEIDGSEKQIGLVNIKKTKNSWEPGAEQIFDKRYKKLLVTCSPLGTEHFLNVNED